MFDDLGLIHLKMTILQLIFILKKGIFIFHGLYEMGE